MENEHENMDDLHDDAAPDEKRDESAISSDLIRGNINTIILRTLSNGDKYGYEIIDVIEKRSHGQYVIKQPTLYSALKRLETQGYVTAYWGGTSNGGRRRYFHLTDAGRDFYILNQKEWEYSRSVIDSLITDFPSEQEPIPENETIDDRSAAEISEYLQNPAEEESAYAVYAEPEDAQEEPLVQPQTEEHDLAHDEKPAPQEQKEHPNYLSMLHEAESATEAEDPYDEERRTAPSVPQPQKDSNGYRDVIGMLYNNAIDTAVAPSKGDSKKALPKAEPQQLSGNIEFFNILERAEYDGIKVRTSGVYKPKEVIPSSNDVPTAFFNKGKAMFLSALCVFAIVFVEFLASLGLRTTFELSLTYCITVLVLGILMLGVFVLLYLGGFGKNAKKIKTSTDSIVSIIVFAIVVLIIAAFAIGKKANLAEIKDLARYILIPAVIAANIIFFNAFYRLFKNKG